MKPREGGACIAISPGPARCGTGDAISPGLNCDSELIEQVSAYPGSVSSRDERRGGNRPAVPAGCHTRKHFSEEVVMSTRQRPSERITEEVTSWPGVTAGPGRRGEFAFKVAGREIGHLHGDRVAHFGFPKAVWHALFDGGRIEYHPVFPGR